MISMRDTLQGAHHLHGLLMTDIRKWWKCYSDREGSAPTSKSVTAEHCSCMPFGIHTFKW